MRQPLQRIIGRAYSGVVCLAVIVPNLLVVAFGVEDFPFTCAPMFAHYINSETDLYIFRFEGIKDGHRFLLGPDEVGRPEAVFMRQFFGNVYGSVHDISPFGTRLNDNEKEFNKRMTYFFTACWEFLSEKRNLRYDTIELKLDKITASGYPVSSFKIGYFDAADQRYHHCPESAQDE